MGDVRQPDHPGHITRLLDRDEIIANILDGLLKEARWEAQQNLNDHIINVAWPAGVDLEDVEHWEDGGTGPLARQNAT